MKIKAQVVQVVAAGLLFFMGTTQQIIKSSEPGRAPQKITFNEAWSDLPPWEEPDFKGRAPESYILAHPENALSAQKREMIEEWLAGVDRLKSEDEWTPQEEHAEGGSLEKWLQELNSNVHSNLHNATVNERKLQDRLRMLEEEKMRKICRRHELEQQLQQQRRVSRSSREFWRNKRPFQPGLTFYKNQSHLQKEDKLVESEKRWNQGNHEYTDILLEINSIGIEIEKTKKQLARLREVNMALKAMRSDLEKPSMAPAILERDEIQPHIINLANILRKSLENGISSKAKTQIFKILKDIYDTICRLEPDLYEVAEAQQERDRFRSNEETPIFCMEIDPEMDKDSKNANISHKENSKEQPLWRHGFDSEEELEQYTFKLLGRLIGSIVEIATSLAFQQEAPKSPKMTRLMQQLEKILTEFTWKSDIPATLSRAYMDSIA